jgi:hypothetical protein
VEWCEAAKERYGKTAVWNTHSMWEWAIAAPAGFMLMIIVLAWLEETVVFPIDRADRITQLMERAGPDEVEGFVAQMLASIAPQRREAS